MSHSLDSNGSRRQTLGAVQEAETQRSQRQPEVRYPLAELLSISQQLASLLQVARLTMAGDYAAVVERVEVAGSIRRRKPTVKDIELVARPVVQEVEQCDLWGEVTGRSSRNLLNEYLDTMLAEEVITQDPAHPVWGDRYRRFLWAGFPVDLFEADANNWGYILALRTGPSDWNKAIMTQIAPGRKIGHYEGKVYRLPEGWSSVPRKMRHVENWLAMYCQEVAVPTEAAYFELLGLPYIDPEERSLRTFSQLGYRIWQARD